jgi:hypothetical protein
LFEVSLSQLSAVPPFVRGPLFAVLFWWIALALGYRVLGLLRVPLSAFDSWEKGLISAAMGAGALQYLPYGLGLFGKMTAPVVSVCLGLLACLLAPDLLRVARGLRAALQALPLRSLSRPTLVWATLFLTMMGLLLVRAMVIGNMGDDDGYHLSSPKRWLVNGTLSYLPSLTNTNASMGFELLYVIGMSVCDALGAKLLHYSAGLLALFAVFLSARRLSSPRAGVLAISLLLIATPVSNLPFLFGVAYVDLGASLMAMTSVLIWLAWRERQKRTLLVCLALCSGLAGSFKVTALAVAIAWLPSLVIEARRQGASLAKTSQVLLTFGTVSLVPVLPWLFRSWRLTGNPLYPMFSSVIPTRDWSAEQAHVFARYMHLYAWGLAAGSRLGETQRKEILLGAVVAALIVATVSFKRIRQPTLRALVLCVAIFFLISVGSTGLLVRYWLPAIMWGSLVVGCLLAMRWDAKPWRLWPACGLLAVALAVQARGDRIELPRHRVLKDARIAAGLSTFDREYPADPLAETWEYINAHTPRDARVLVAAFYQTFGAATYGGFWVDRPFYVTDAHLQTAIRLDDWTAFLVSVRDAGISHVVISDRLFNAGRQGFSFRAGSNEYPFCRRLVDEHGEKLGQFGALQVYHVDVRGALTATKPKPGPGVLGVASGI